MNIVIPTTFDRSPHIWDLITEAKQVAHVVLVHTTPTDPVPGTTTVHSTARNIQTWWNAGLDQCDGPTLVLNDDVIASAHMLEQLLDALQESDMVTLPAWGVTNMSGFCFGIHPERIRPDEAFTWYYGDDDLWMRAKHSGLTIEQIPVPIIHDTYDRTTQYPAEFAEAVARDRQLYADRWLGGNTMGLP